MKRITTVMVLALTTVACTSPAGTDRAPAYFEALRPVAREVTGAVSEARKVFDQAYESEAMRATRLVDVRSGYDLAIAADRASRLEPVSAYRTDHDRYLATIADLRAIYRSYDEAVATGNAAGAAAAATAMESAAGLGFAGLSGEYCARVTFDMRLCNRPPGLEPYDAAFAATLLDLAAGYIPLMRPAPPALSGDEAAAYLEVIDEAAAARLDVLAAALSGADPPSDRIAGRDAVLAAVAEAAALHHSGGDHAALAPIFCTLAGVLQGPDAELAAVFLDDDDLSCGT